MSLIRKAFGVSMFRGVGNPQMRTPHSRCKIVATPTQSTNVKPAKRAGQQAMVEGKQTWHAWSREISEKRGAGTEVGKNGFIGVTLSTTIVDLQSEVTRAVTEVMPR